MRALIKALTVAQDSITLTVEVQDPSLDGQVLTIGISTLDWLAWKTANPTLTVADFLKEKITERLELLKTTIQMAGRLKGVIIEIP